MSVRKRTWTAARGTSKEAWIVDYTDARRPNAAARCA